MHYNLCDTIADIVQNSIEANATLVEVELTETENNLTVYIRDNGCGMSAEDVKNAQNPFLQLNEKHQTGFCCLFVSIRLRLLHLFVLMCIPCIFILLFHIFR